MPDSNELSPRPVKSLSPSRAGDFSTCPLLFRFRTIDRLPEPPSPQAARGTLVHAVLERLFDLPAPERTVESAVGMLDAQWEGLLESDPGLCELFGQGQAPPQSWLDSAAVLLQSYFAMEDPKMLEPAGRELKIEVELPSGLTLRGFVDRLDVGTGGQLRVVDYKTGRAPGPGFEAKAMFQMRFYALAIWRMRKEMPAMLQLMYLSSGTTLRYQPDEADLISTERKIAALWAAIERAMISGDWRANPTKLCDWCNHKALCPAWGGTPPALPSPSAAPGRSGDPAGAA